MQGFKSGNQV